MGPCAVRPKRNEAWLANNTTYTYTAPQHIWINHEVLSERLLGAFTRATPAAFVLALKCTFGVTLIGFLTVIALRSEVGWITTAVSMGLISLCLMNFWNL